MDTTVYKREATVALAGDYASRLDLSRHAFGAWAKHSIRHGMRGRLETLIFATKAEEAGEVWPAQGAHLPIAVDGLLVENGSNRTHAGRLVVVKERALAVLVPMSEAEFESFVALAIPAYADDKVASGQWAAGQSLELSRKAFEELLPCGRETPDNYLYCIVDDRAQRVGTLWLAAKEQAGQRIGYIYDIRIQPEFRRRGHATRALTALEDEARKLGLRGIGLHVFGHNVRAQALYAGLGYRPTNVNMFKALQR